VIGCVSLPQRVARWLPVQRLHHHQQLPASYLNHMLLIAGKDSTQHALYAQQPVTVPLNGAHTPQPNPHFTCIDNLEAGACCVTWHCGSSQHHCSLACPQMQTPVNMTPLIAACGHQAETPPRTPGKPATQEPPAGAPLKRGIISQEQHHIKLQQRSRTKHRPGNLTKPAAQDPGPVQHCESRLLPGRRGGGGRDTA
jgi:hypothetical protein